ncbi:MAG TPA: pilus assembly protein [Thiopseudomonas sp.]|nr:pilus assembly protein [Thiopseudomonas sp.]
MMEQTFLACVADDEDINWLQSSIATVGHVLRTPQNLDSLLGLIEATGATLVFVNIDRNNLINQCALIESLLEARPLTAVVVVGDGFDNELVIAAMRAGARDFITYGQRSSEVLGLVRRITDRLPQLQSRRERGELSVMCGNQPDADAAFVAVHLALLMQKQGERVLLVDLGVPNGESLDILGLELGFTFDDAMRNLRRIDRSLIDNAFVVHESSGLTVLPAGDNGSVLSSSNSSELFLLMSALRQNFDKVFVNICGQTDCEALRTLVGFADEINWYSNTSVSACRRNLDLLAHWRDSGIKLEKAQLILDRYSTQVAPDSRTLSKTFAMPLRGTLPHNPELRLQSINQGQSVFMLLPRDPLSKGLLSLLKADSQQKSLSTGLFARLMGSTK